MLSSVIAAVIVFVAVFGGLRIGEWIFHRLRHTPDWSPHWGSWFFALLLGIYVLINDIGRSL